MLNSSNQSKLTVVVLISDKRSGSTLFQKELVKHPLIKTLEYSPHTYTESHHWLKGAVMLSKDGQGFHANKIYKGYGSRKNARKYMEDCIKGNVSDFSIPFSDKDLIFNGWEALCTKYAHPLFFEKSPQIIAHTAALDLLFEWYQQTKFNVKFIFLVRNPMSIMYSAYQLFYTKPNTRQWGWSDLMNNMFQFYDRVGEGDRIWLKYENMVENPEVFFQNVLEFIGLPLDPKVGRDAHRKSLNKWISDSNYSFHFDEQLLPLVERLGYSNTDIYNMPGKKPSRSHLVKFWLNRNVKLPFFRFLDRILNPILLKWKKN